MDGILTLYDALFQRTCANAHSRKRLYKLQCGEGTSQLLNLSFSRFTRRY